MDMNRKAESYLTKHKYQKRKTICTALLSVLMVFCVVSSLIMPAVSMTIDAVQEFVVDEEEMELYAAPPADAPNAVDITTGESYTVTVTVDGHHVIYSNDSTTSTEDYTISGNETDIAFDLSYTINNVVESLPSSGPHLYMSIENLTDCVSFNEQQAMGNVQDTAYYESTFKDTAGTYVIEGGYVKITLTNDYIDWVKSQEGGNLVGTLNFSGTISRANTETGDQTLNIGNVQIPVKFEDRYPEITSKSGNLDTADGTIDWTIVINNSDGIDLSGYHFTDSMLEDSGISLAEDTSIVIEPSTAATENGKTITFTAGSKDAKTITIKYTTKLTEEQLKTNAASLNNTAQLTKDNYTSEKTGSVWLSNAFTVNKSGAPNYTSKKIDWTITIQSEYGVSLDGYQIADNNIPAGATVSPSGTLKNEGNGVWSLSGTNGAKTVTISYSTDPSKTDETVTDNNTVNLQFPSGKPTGDSTTASVTYKKQSDLINFNKSVASYNQDTHEITWSITVTPEWLENENRHYSLEGYSLTDSKFSSLTLDDLTFEPGYLDLKDGGKVTLTGDTLTFHTDVRQIVTITYKERVEFEGTKAVTVTNPISDSNGHTTTVETAVTPRNSFSKTLVGSDTKTEAANGQLNETLNWQAEILWDGKFANLALQDKPGVTIHVESGVNVNASHTLNQDSIVVSAKKASGDGYTTIDASNYTIASNDTGFTITFHDNNTLDTNGYNYVLIEYSTTATMDSVQGVENAFANGSIEYEFTNEGSFNGLSSEENTFTFIRTNPDVDEKADITITKQWNDQDNASRPDNVTVKLEYKKQVGSTWDVNWHDVKGTQGDYLFYDETAGADNTAYNAAATFTYVMNQSNDWQMDLKTLGLPKTEASANADGSQGTVVNYCYRVVEVKAGDTEISNNFFRVENGSYEVTYLANNGTSLFENGIQSGTMTITNTFRKNIAVQAKKTWDGDGKTYPVVVTLQRSYDGQNWSDYTPTDSSSATVTLDSANEFSHIWDNLPAMGVENNVHVEYQYRIVEAKFDGQEVTDDGQRFVIRNDDQTIAGYYEVTQRISATAKSNSSNNLDTQTLEVKNTYHPTNTITISANKKWSDEAHQLKGVVVQLQRKAEGANPTDWEAYPDDDTSKQTLDSKNNWTCSWSDLPNQQIDENNNITKYTYQVVEVGVQNGDSTVNFGDRVQIDQKFAVETDGYYQIDYSTVDSWVNDTNSLDANGTIYITNTYRSVATASITPQKVWKDDSAYASQRPEVTFELQQKIGDGEWQSLHGELQDGVFVVDESKDAYRVTLNSQNQVSWSDSTWELATITGLPEKVLTVNSANGTYTETYCSYRFVEVVTVDGQEQILADGDSYTETFGGSVDGKFTVSINGGTVTNTFSEDIGIDKRIIDHNGNTITTITKDDLNNFMKTIDGVDYYIFNWVVNYDGNQPSKITQIVDELPDGFTLCTDDENWGGKQVYWRSPSDTDETSAITGKGLTSSDYLQGRLFDGYYEQPGMVWPGYGYNCATAETAPEAVWSHWENSEWYYYDTETNNVYFNKPRIWAMMAVCYSTKIKCEDLEAKLEKGSYTVENYVVKLNQDGTETDKTDIASLTITNTQNRGLITKDYSATLIPGYIQYSLDVNPEGKNLSTGDTIDIADLFQTNSYYDHDWNTSNKATDETTYGDKLIDVVMNNIRVYQYDANGNETLLPVNQYTILFQNSSELDTGAALLQLTVPDEMHLRIVYSYKLVANENTPSVLNGCLSSTRENGRYAVMRPGLIPPEGDKIVFSNTATLTSDSATDSSSKNNIEYEVFRSGGTISTNTLPSITKVNTGDYTINDLAATFLLARYDAASDMWYYAGAIGDKGVITWEEDGYSKTSLSSSAAKIDTADGPVSVNLEEGVLYKLVEISVPDDYEGSNLTNSSGDVLSAAEYETLIRAYLNSGVTITGGINYSNFLTNHVHIHYFAYNSTLSGDALPAGVTSENVMQIRTGGNIEIPNNELVDITVNKSWIGTDGNVEENKEASVTVELYWSYTKSSTGIPEDAMLATAEDLGIVESGFTNTKTITTPEQLPTTPTWENLPNGKNDRPIYYYIKETAYTIGEKIYELMDNGQYICTDDSSNGGYLPTYIGNASYVTTGSDDTVQNNVHVTINNSQQLMLKKVWRNADGGELAERYIPIDTLQVAIYGYDADNQRTANPLVTTTLKKSESWQTNITNLVQNIDLSQYKSFEAVEIGSNASLDGFVVSCVFNLNQNTGEITVTNRSTQPTEASVTVNKIWSDGADLHKSDSVAVTLYRTVAQVRSDQLTNLTADMLIEEYNAHVVTQTDENDTQEYEDLLLSANNNWTYTWTGLPLDNGTDDTDATQSYYYYAVESQIKATDSDEYTPTYEAVVNGAKTTYNITNTRNAIVVQKQWYDENGNVLVKYNENGELVDAEGNVLGDAAYDLYDSLKATVEVYQQTVQKPTEAISVVAFGDSITDGYGELSRGEYCYPTQLTKLLTDGGYTLSGGSISNQGVSQQQIDDANQGFRSRITSAIPSDTDIVLFLGGTNDIHQSSSSVRGNPDGVYARFEACIEEIKTQAPNAVIFVGSIPHFDFYKNNTLTDGGSWWNWLSGYADDDGAIPNGLIDQYNAKIRAYAESSSTDNVYYVDVCSVVTDDLIRADGCHPNASGYTAIANAYFKAINNYYTTSDDAFSTTVTLNRNNNWTAAVDVPDNGAYYVRETALSGWTVTYSDPATTNGVSITPISQTAGGKVLVMNTLNNPKTNLTVEKTWKGDTASDRPENISLTLLRKTDTDGDWEEYLATPTVDKTSNTNQWIFTYENLPAEDMSGKLYSYKVEEGPLSGYTVSYGENNGPDGKGLKAVEDENAGRLTLTNTRSVSLKLQKVWDDQNQDHTGDSVTVKLYRSTTEPTDTANLALSLSSSNVSVSADGTAKVTANKTITGATILSDDSDIATASLGEDGITITINGISQGTTQITVMYENDSGVEETATIGVTVSNLAIWLGNDNSVTQLTAGTPVAISARLNDKEMPNAIFEVTSGNATISNGQITASAVGNITIKATVTDDTGMTHTAERTVSVGYPEFSVSDVTIAQGGTMTITPPDSYGGFSYSIAPSSGKITLSGNTISVASDATIGETATITVSRDGVEKTFIVTVVQQNVYELTSAGDIDLSAYTDKTITGMVIEFIEVPSGSYDIRLNSRLGETGNGAQLHYIGWVDSNGSTITNVQYATNNSTTYSGATLTVSNINVTGVKCLYIGIGCKVKLTITTSDSGGSTTTTTTTISGDTATTTTTTTTTTTVTSDPDPTPGGDTNGGSFDTFITAGTIKLDASKTPESIIITGLTSTNQWYDYVSIKPNANDWSNYAGLTYSNGSWSVGNGGYFNVETDNNSIFIITFTQTVNLSELYVSANNGVKFSYTVNYATSTNALTLSAADAPIQLYAASEVNSAPSTMRTAGEWTWTSDAKGSYITITIDRVPNQGEEEWTYIVENLEPYDSGGQPYFYWAEEVIDGVTTGYTPLYTYTDDDPAQDTALNAGNLGDGTITIRNVKTQTTNVTLPSTGGTGTRIYTITGAALMSSATAAYILIRRRRKASRMK